MTTKSTTTWKVVGTEAHALEGREGEVVMGMMLRCLEDGCDYVVTVSGIGTTPGANFVNALRAGAAHIARSVGGTTPDETTHYEVH